MQKSLRLVLLTTIVLLNCSISWCQNDNHTISSTGELTATSDSVLVAFDDLRKANAKMVELKYQKEINDSLRSIIVVDEKIMREYNDNVNALQKQIKQEVRKRKIAGWLGVLVSVSLAIALIVK